MSSKVLLVVLGMALAVFFLAPGSTDACAGGWHYDCDFYADSYGTWDPEYGIVCQGSGGGCHDCWCVCNSTGQPFPC